MGSLWGPFFNVMYPRYPVGSEDTSSTGKLIANACGQQLRMPQRSVSFHIFAKPAFSVSCMLGLILWSFPLLKRHRSRWSNKSVHISFLFGVVDNRGFVLGLRPAAPHDPMFGKLCCQMMDTALGYKRAKFGLSGRRCLCDLSLLGQC